MELLELSGNNANQEKSKFGDRFLNNTSFELMFQSYDVQNESKIEIFEDCFFRFEWCSGNFSKAPIDLGGHTMSEVGIQLKSNSILHNQFLTQIKTFCFKLVLVAKCTLFKQVNVIEYVNSKVGNADFVSGHHTTQVSSR